MKKLLFAFVLVFFSSLVFAQNEVASKLLGRAKVYEGQGQLAYALGYYYDAMEADLEDCDAAYQGWRRLAETIESGKPGFEDYNAFALQDNWRKLLQNAEKYWTEFPYWGVEVEPVVQGEVDAETGNPTYIARVRIFETEKNKTIRDLLLRGLGNAYSTNDYHINTSEEEDSWPEYSLFADRSVDMHRFLSVSLSICDANGKVILPGTNFVLDSAKKKKNEGGKEILYYAYKNYVWHGGNESVTKAIESGEYKILPTSYSTECRVFNESGQKDEKKSSKIQYAVDKSEFLVEGKTATESVLVVVAKKQEADRKRMEREKTYLMNFDIKSKEELLEKIIEDNTMTKDYTVAIGSNYMEAVCNALSELMGYSFAYTSESDELVAESNGFYCKPDNDSEEYYRAAQAFQIKKPYYIHSLDPELEAKIMASIQQKRDDFKKLLENQKPIVNNEILKFLAKTKANSDGIIKKFQNGTYTPEYIKERIEDLLDRELIVAEKGGKYVLTKEGKTQIQ